MSSSSPNYCTYNPVSEDTLTYYFVFLLLFHPCSFDFFLLLFFFNDTATTEIYTLSLYDALPIYAGIADEITQNRIREIIIERKAAVQDIADLQEELRSEEHTSELQSHSDLVCRLLLEKKKTETYE